MFNHSWLDSNNMFNPTVLDLSNNMSNPTVLDLS